jgi:hypothetical protein
MTKFSLIFFVSIFILLAASTNTFAQNTNTFSLVIEPAYQEVEIPEDQEDVTTTITIKNPSDNSQQVELFAFDFKQSDHFGSISLLNGITEKYPHTLASFLSFEKSSITINAQSEETINIVVQNRATLSPGGHYAAVIIRSLNEQINQQQKILPAISSLLLVRKSGGERINLSLKDFGWKPKSIVTKIPTKINLTFENGGNTHVIPRGQIKILDMFNRVVFQGTINDSSLYLLPGTIRIIPNKINQSIRSVPIMFYSVQAKGNSNIGESNFYSEQSFLYIDIKLLYALTIIFGYFIFKKFKKKNK